MNLRRNRIFALVFFVLVTAALSPHAHALHPDVLLRDPDGNSVAGTNKAYSPKRTCGTTACHDQDFALKYGITNNIYEDTRAIAVKDHGTGYPSYGNAYKVPYPMHGVSAGYHFQQGRDATWRDSRKSLHALPGFSGPSGMQGKY